MDFTDIKEGKRFYDPRRGQGGKLTARTYHNTGLWMMLYDDGTLEELLVSDLKEIQEEE